MRAAYWLQVVHIFCINRRIAWRTRKQSGRTSRPAAEAPHQIMTCRLSPGPHPSHVGVPAGAPGGGVAAPRGPAARPWQAAGPPDVSLPPGPVHDIRSPDDTRCSTPLPWSHRPGAACSANLPPHPHPHPASFWHATSSSDAPAARRPWLCCARLPLPFSGSADFGHPYVASQVWQRGAVGCVRRILPRWLPTMPC